MSEEAGEYKAGPPRAPVSFDIDDAFEEFMRKSICLIPSAFDWAISLSYQLLLPFSPLRLRIVLMP